MKVRLINKFKSKSGSSYKIYVRVANDRYMSFYIKWKNYLFGLIPYYSLIRTDYESIDNHPLEFRNYEDSMNWINKFEEECGLTPYSINK